MVTKRRDANKRGQERLTSFIDLLKWRETDGRADDAREKSRRAVYPRVFNMFFIFSLFLEYLVHFPFLGLIILGDVLFEHWNLS